MLAFLLACTEPLEDRTPIVDEPLMNDTFQPDSVSRSAIFCARASMASASI